MVHDNPLEPSWLWQFCGSGNSSRSSVTVPACQARRHGQRRLLSPQGPAGSSLLWPEERPV